MNTRRISLYLLPVLLLMGAMARPAAAQHKFTFLTFPSGSASADGYTHAVYRLIYRFDDCGSGGPRVIFGLQDGSGTADLTYWYQGTLHTIDQRTFAPPRRPQFKATVYTSYGATELTRWDTHSTPVVSPSSLTCGGSAPFAGSMGEWAEILGGNPTPEQRRDALNQLDFKQEFHTERPLQNPEVEAWIRKTIADSLRAERDAEAASQAQNQQAAGESSAASGTADTAPAGQSGSVRTTPTHESEADQPASTAADQARAAAARQARADSIMNAIYEEQRRQARQEEEMVSAATGFVGQVLAGQQQTRERNAAIAARRFAAYQAVREENLRRAGDRPRCMERDAQADLDLEAPVHGRLDGTECRLEYRQSADIYRVTLPTKGVFLFSIRARGFNPLLVLKQGDRVLAESTTTIKIHTEWSHVSCMNGCTLIVTSAQYGEVGGYTLQTDFRSVSQGMGIVLGVAVHGGTLSSGSTSDIGSAPGSVKTQGPGLLLGFNYDRYRIFAEYLWDIIENPAWEESLEPYDFPGSTAMIGVRAFMRDDDADMRPYVESGLGSRKRDLDSRSSDRGPIFMAGAGVELWAREWFSFGAGVRYGLTSFSDTGVMEHGFKFMMTNSFLWR